VSEPIWQRILPNAPGIGGEELLPLVSVVITTFNYARFVRDCIASVAVQTYPKIECIVVDDCSNDGTEDIVRQHFALHCDPRFSYVRNETNLGQLGAQAIGLSHSRGSFIVFLDADDLLMPHFIERHVFIHLNTSFPVAFSASDQIVIDGNGAIVANTRRNLNTIAELSSACLFEVPASGVTPAAAIVLVPWHHALTHIGWVWGEQSSLMFRRSILELIMPPLEACGLYRICADSYLARIAHLLGNSMLLMETLGAYRMHQKNNYAAQGVISFEEPGGDKRKLPTMRALAKLSFSVMRLRQDAFVLNFGSWRVEAVKPIIRSWLAVEHAEAATAPPAIMKEKGRTAEALDPGIKPPFWDARGHFLRWQRERESRNRGAIDAACPGYSTEEHWRFFHELIGTRAIRDIALLGVYLGRDISYMSSAFRRAWMRRYSIVGIDRFADVPGEDWPENLRHLGWKEAGFGESPSLESVRRNLATTRSLRNVTLVKGEVHKLRSLNRTFDFVYIDVSHDYETTLMAIDLAKDCVRPGGFIGGDDFSDRGTWGVKSAVEDSFDTFEVFGQRIWLANADDRGERRLL
jgi:hypothetical protein